MEKLKNDEKSSPRKKDRNNSTNGDDDDTEESDNEAEEVSADDMEGMIVVDEVFDIANSNYDTEERKTTEISEENKEKSSKRQIQECSKLSSEENEELVEGGTKYDNSKEIGEMSERSPEECMLNVVSSDNENRGIFKTSNKDSKIESLESGSHESSEQTYEDRKGSEEEKILELENSCNGDQKEETIETLKEDGEKNSLKKEIPEFSAVSSENVLECSNGICNVEENSSEGDETSRENSKDTSILKTLDSREQGSNQETVKSPAKSQKTKPSKKKQHGRSKLSINENDSCPENSDISVRKAGIEDSVEKSAPEIVSSVERKKKEEIFKKSKQGKKRKSSTRRNRKSFNSSSKKMENCSKHCEDENVCASKQTETKSDNSGNVNDEDLHTTSSVAEKNKNKVAPSSSDPKNSILHWNPRVYLPRLSIEAYISSTPTMKVNIPDSFWKENENSDKECKNKCNSEKNEEIRQDLGSSQNENIRPMVPFQENDTKKAEKGDSEKDTKKLEKSDCCVPETKKSKNSFEHGKKESSHTESDRCKDLEDLKNEHNSKTLLKKKISKDYKNEDIAGGKKDKGEDAENLKDQDISTIPSLKKCKNTSELAKIEGENNSEEKKKEDSEDMKVKNLISNFKIPLMKKRKPEKNENLEKMSDNWSSLLNEKCFEYDKHGGSNHYKRRREENENSKHLNSRQNSSQSLEIREKSSEDGRNKNRFNARNQKNEDSRNLQDRNHSFGLSMKERERSITDRKYEREDSANLKHANHSSVPLLPKKEESLVDLKDGSSRRRRNYDPNNLASSKSRDDSFSSFIRKRKNSSENTKDERCSEEKRKREDSKDLKRRKLYETLPLLEEYWKAVEYDPTDFYGWTDLLRYVDSANNIEAACEAYDDFLSRYPYCYGYWRKYADFLKNHKDKEGCEKIFEKGIQATPLSVDLWLHYLEYARDASSNDENRIRELFEKSLSACGLEFRSDKLWETCVRWETGVGNLVNVTKIFDRWLEVPTRGYITVIDKFREHMEKNSLDDNLDAKEYFSLRNEVLNEMRSREAVTESKLSEGNLMKVNETMKEKILNIRRERHKNTQKEALARWAYEENIKRPYFHVKPLENSQLENWTQYLDFEIKEGNHTRIIVLFERCLIACASYEAFWIKFVDYLSSLTEVDVEKVRGVFNRACTIHHSKKLKIHLKWAQFEQTHGDSLRATSILEKMEKLCPNVLMLMIRRVSLLRLCGEFDLVCSLYEQYIESTADKKGIDSDIAIEYARFCSQVSINIQSAYDILMEAIKKDKVESLCPSVSPYFDHRWFYECCFGHYHTVYYNIQVKYWDERKGYESGDFVITDPQPGGPRVSECAKKEMKRVNVEDNSCDIKPCLFTTSNQDYSALLPMDNTVSTESSIVDNPVMISELMVSLNKVSPSEQIRLRIPKEKYREQKNMIRPKETRVLRPPSHFNQFHAKNFRSRPSSSNLLVNDMPQNKHKKCNI